MVRTCKALAVVLLMIGASGLGWNLATATAAPSEVVPYGAGAYRYQQVPTGGGAATFSNVSFDDTAFSVGDAPFGHAVPEFGCALAPATPWSPNTDLLVRRAVSLPAGTTDVVIHIAIDNDIQLFRIADRAIAVAHFEPDRIARRIEPLARKFEEIAHVEDRIRTERSRSMGWTGSLE